MSTLSTLNEKPDGKELVVRGQPSTPAGSGSSSSTQAQIIANWNRWRERYNPLRALNIARAVSLMEQEQRGEMADPQWVYFFLEKSDADLLALVERRTSALLEMDWAVRQVATEKDPEGKVLWPVGYDADLAQKQAAALREAYEGIDNVYEAIGHLCLASFRGYAHCEKHRNADGDIYHLELVDQWNAVRDLLRGGWRYNPDALSTTYWGLPAENEMLPANFLAREKDRHVDRIALVKFIRASLCEKDWDAFVEIYGIPSGVVVGPPSVPAEKEKEYEASARAIAEGGSGYLPNGSTYEANDSPRGTSPFKDRLDHLSEKLILAGTGGMLTMLAQSGSGTLAGGAHADTFAALARAEAREISQLFQRAVDAEILERQFPGQPRLAYFEIAASDEVDAGDLATQIAALGTAGYLVDCEQLSEKTGLKISLKPTPPPPVFGAPGKPGEQPPKPGEPLESKPGEPTEPKVDPEPEPKDGLHTAPKPPVQNRGKGDARAKPAVSVQADPDWDRFLNRARAALAQATGQDLAPLRTALSKALEASDDDLPARMRQLEQELPCLAPEVIHSPHAAAALEGILGAVLGNQLAEPSE